jgi:molybdopterin-containing oxidoreductase family iron-sulfur binding subunit
MNKIQGEIKEKVTRRQFFKLGSIAGVTATGLPKTANAKNSLAGKKLAMVIDLQKCTGCGGCIITCKSENNVQDGAAWSNKISRTVGKFPNLRFDFMPILCNHCENAPCIQVCPTNAMHKGDGDIIMHNPKKCIGCKTCIASCPYKAIYYNKKKPHPFWKSKQVLIKDCTSAPYEVTEKIDSHTIPHYNPAREESTPGSGLRYKGIVEKCTFCDHRIKKGQLPFCVEGCPANARIMGDLNDPDSEVSRLLGKYTPIRLKEHLGTEPKVFYIRTFNPASYQSTKGSI